MENILEGASSDKLFCRIVSEAVAGVIRHSMENTGTFRQQCYELLQFQEDTQYLSQNVTLISVLSLMYETMFRTYVKQQVTSTKDAETELERRLLNITLGEIGINKDIKRSHETDIDELQLDKTSLNWDTVTGEHSSASTDKWLTQVEDWP